MEWVEVTGRTIAEALDTALDRLGVSEEDLEYEVLVAPRGGLFGRLGGGARIRARVKPLSREKPGERRNRGRRSKTEVGSRSGQASEQQTGPAKSSRRRRSRGGQRSGSESTGPKPASDGPRPDTAAEKPAPAKPVREKKGQDMADVVEVPVGEQAQQAEEFVRGLVAAFGARATVATVVDDDVIHLDVTGDDLGLLVGPKGATLEGVEELVRTYMQRRTDGHGARIFVDVGGYRAKRRAALAAYATELADKVRESGRDLALEPMSAADRKVVHDTVAELDGVATVSEGEEPRRRVVLRKS